MVQLNLVITSMKQQTTFEHNFHDSLRFTSNYENVWNKRKFPWRHMTNLPSAP